MRRLLLLTSFAGSLVACASLLGDFEVDPSLDSTVDGSTGADGSSSSSSGSGEGGPTIDSGSDAPVTDLEPIGLNVAVSASASCATVQYKSGRQVTYCWGAEGAQFGLTTLGAKNDAVSFEGFYRPQLPTTETRYLTFSTLTGAGTNEWFVGRGTDGEKTGTYAWGTNVNGESAAGSRTSTLPNDLVFNGLSLAFDHVYAAPNHGCVVQNASAATPGFKCWGWNQNCELRGETSPGLLCNAEPPALLDQKAVAVEDELTHTSGKVGPVLRMAGGLDHSCIQVRSAELGPDAQDEIYCWGSNLLGQVENSGITPIKTPQPVKSVRVRRSVAELAAGENHTCAIAGASRIICWGANGGGQVKPGSVTQKEGPFSVDVQGQISLLRAAGTLSCVVGKEAQSPSRAYCWGSGPKGRAPAELDAPVAKVAGIQDITALALGRGHACAVAKREGATRTDPARVFCWGSANQFKRVNPRAAIGEAFPQPIEIKFPVEPPN